MIRVVHLLPGKPPKIKMLPPEFLLSMPAHELYYYHLPKEACEALGVEAFRRCYQRKTSLDEG